MAQPRSFAEIYDIYRNEVENNASDLTDFNEGSINDILAGATSTALVEAMGLIIDRFNKTYFDTANGPEVTGSTDDLQTLAVDHFGSDFARPAAQPAVGIVTFSRPNTSNGDVTINAGTIVKTATNANGESQRFSVVSEVLMTGLTVNASIQAVNPGTKGNVDAASIVIIESTLTDASVLVTNALATSGGADQQNDAQYRQTILNKIAQLKGATENAIESTALTVSGVIQANAVEAMQAVINYNPALSVSYGAYYSIPFVTLYVSDANGSANDALIGQVQTAINNVRACGVLINVVGATSQALNWTAHITLNPSGPHYSTLSANAKMILDSMTSYINNLAIGSGFTVASANAAILALWGPSGTNDLTAFSTSTPTGDVASVAGVKLVAGTVALS